jgi:S-adenosylmethionine-diacylglycerol 3-amino-3-carboxypropyl transferase
MKQQLTEKVKFDFIRYANCWEDADILLQALAPKPGSKILSIASAGDNSFSLLCSDPNLVIAIDLSSVQLYLTELKKSCFQELDYETTLSFLGFTPSQNRLEVYGKLRTRMSDEAARYFNVNPDLIKNGIIHQGKFEKYFQLFAHKILPLIHTKDRIDKLFKEKTESEQNIFYQDHWNNWRWKMLFKIFFSRKNMGKRGRDPQFLREVNVNVSDFIYSKAEKHLSSTDAQNNFMLNYALRGNHSGDLPHYMRRENFERIKKNSSKLILMKGYVEEAFKTYGSFDFFNLSNIFEYMSKEDFHKVRHILLTGCNSEARLAYWNLMVPRRLSENCEHLHFDEKISRELSTKDKGFFYNNFLIDTFKKSS